MEPPSRYLEPERGQLGRRRGHLPQISISDDSHHVTEAIGDMYGDFEGPKRDSRPLSYLTSPPNPTSASPHDSHNDPYRSPRHDGTPQFDPTAASRSPPTDKHSPSINGSPREGRPRQSSLGSSPGSPPILTRANSQDTATQAFPLNDIDYESSPAAVAQELSNLQAIRRMSMNVDAADPDLPTFAGPSFNVPSPPSPSDDEDDASRMFWVPARLHPELAPKEFKTFVEDRVERIRRSHEGEGSLSPTGSVRRRSSSSLSRRKSMLSKTIEDATGWEDGADVLERKRSQSSQLALDTSETTLEELGQLVNDPQELVRKMSIDSSRQSLEAGSDGSANEDMPILPAAPGGQPLKRSTRTNYRRGSLRKGERVAASRRAAQRYMEGDPDDQSPVSPTGPGPSFEDEQLQAMQPQPLQPQQQQQQPPPPPRSLARVQTEPITSHSEPPPDNFSRPSRRARPSPQTSTLGPPEDPSTSERSGQSTEPPTQRSPPHKPFQSRIASNGRTTAPFPGYVPPASVPQIFETPPPQSAESWQATQPPPFNHVQNLPERKSSHEYSRQASLYNRSQVPQVQERQPMRPVITRAQSANQTLDDMANSPSLMPGTSTRTDALSFIPTFAAEEKKPEKKKERKDSTDSTGPRKSSWGWLLGSQSQDSESKKEEKESAKKSKSKVKAVNEKAYHDATRLDVLQTAVEGPKGRESLVLDRESVKLDEERKKIKSSGADSRKERDTGLFSSLFGGKKKGDREGWSKKSERDRRLSPEPPPRILRADIDYNWTRFSILEERAIYRMAHIKLANPRRALYSQVLLSNFMYSYLAKVQQMHPQIQIPAFVQKQSQKGAVEQPPESQSEEYSQWAMYQEEHQSAHGLSSDGASPAFVEDYGPEHQQDEDLRQLQQQQQVQSHQYLNGNGLGVYNHHQQDQSWDHRNAYDDQGLFDDQHLEEEALW